MAYSAPTTITTGQLVTASLMNADWGGNITFLANPPACRVYHAATQSIVTSGTPQILAFNTERFDTNTMHDTVTNNSRITINTAGLYVVNAYVEFAASATGTREVDLLVNGTTFIAVDLRPATAAGTTVIAVSSMWKFAATDYVQARVTQSSGGALNVSAGSATSAHTCDFSAAWVGLG